MHSKCEHCGEFAVEDSDNIEVCKSCGVVANEGTFSTAECAPVSRPTFRPYTKSESRLNRWKSKPISLLHGQKVLDNLCHINNISLKGKTEISELFKLVASVKRFFRKEDAGTAAACCLFLLLRKNGQIIPINTICKQVPCTKGKFSTLLKFVKSCLSSNEKFRQYSFILENCASDYKKNEEEMPEIVPSLVHEVCEKADSTEKSELMEKTASLVKLAYSCWLFTGRSPKSIVVASAYLCWRSMRPKCKTVPFAKFCKSFEIKDSTALLRIPELKTLLLKLGQMIPSVIENYVNEKNLHFHLNTILKHSETLRNDLFPDAFTFEQVDAVEYTTFRYPSQKNHPRKEASDAVQYDSDMNASDIEISDSEIESYIVSDKKKIVELCKKKKLNDLMKKS